MNKLWVHNSHRTPVTRRPAILKTLPFEALQFTQSALNSCSHALVNICSYNVYVPFTSCWTSSDCWHILPQNEFLSVLCNVRQRTKDSNCLSEIADRDRYDVSESDSAAPLHSATVGARCGGGGDRASGWTHFCLHLSSAGDSPLANTHNEFNFSFWIYKEKRIYFDIIMCTVFLN